MPSSILILDYERPGSLDPSYYPSPEIRIDEGINSLVVQPDGKVWVSGYHGFGSPFLGRLNPDGSLDSSFIAGYQWGFIGLQSGSRAIIFGYSETLGCYTFQRVSADGSIDLSYAATECDDHYFAGVVQPDDKVIVLRFPALNGDPFTFARFNADGGANGSFTQLPVDGFV